MKFENKTVLVSGAASGIGLNIARRFLAEGATVIATDLNIDRLETLAVELGEKFLPRRCDAGSVAEIEALFVGIDQLDVLVNNAGIGIMENPENLNEAAFDKQYAVLIKGPIFHVKYAAPLLRASGGSVINISSASALLSLPGYTAYGSAKEALVKFTQDSVVTVPGVRHNVILPGLIDTPILKDAYGEDAFEKLQQVAQITPVPRLGQPEDIAAATLFLASAEASFITGSQLVVDGGLSRLHVMSMPV
ncbi:SDR family NAD(P)-dependent oxidoreductase [Zhongshania aliphaticivorans]|uniref:SDR family NAD(P)-dependent oxidoreductase n=1 Tax=Zhongshania aliphaticivorans TaxID=1470434 RepID=UPI0039C96254